MTPTKTCPVCSGDVRVSASLGTSPVSGYSCDSIEQALREPVFDAELNLCTNCLTLFQTFNPLADGILHRLYSNHAATIRSSARYNAYYDRFTDTVVDRLSATAADDPGVLEIGCNDGLLLATLGAKRAATLIGVEPSGQFEQIWADRAITGTKAFFGEDLARAIHADRGPMDVIIARHVVEHIPDPHDFFRGLRLLTSDATVIFIEVPYLISILGGFRYDNVGYSHLIHYSVTSMTHLCRLHGLVVRGFHLVDVDGGSVVFEISRRKSRDDNAEQTPESQDEVLGLYRRYVECFPRRRDAFAAELADAGTGDVVGFGAGAKGQFLMHIYRLEHLLNRVFDETPGLAGTYIPGTRIRIEAPSFDDCADDTLFVNLAPTHAEHIRAKLPSRFRMLDPING